MAKRKSPNTPKRDHTLCGEMHAPIISAAKRVFSRSPTVKEFLYKHRIEGDWVKKNGTLSTRKHVFYLCNICKKQYPSTQVQVDHISPVIPVNIPSKYMSYDEIFDRLFCDEINLQILCKADHKEKSVLENAARKKWAEVEKFIVYKTTNRVNNRCYVGVHKCINWDDNYLGSGTIFKRAIAKYGRENFYKQILFVFDNAEDAYAKEKEIVTPEIVSDPTYYNVTIGGVGSKLHNTGSNKKRIICHQTGQVFASISEAAKFYDVDVGWLNRSVNDAWQPIKGFHFFDVATYNPRTPVFFPKNEAAREIVCLNNGVTYSSVLQAAKELELNYKSLRNALIDRTEDDVFKYKGLYFINGYEYEIDNKYVVHNTKVKCIELDMLFDNCAEAARFLKHKNPNHGGIAVGKACREHTKMYKYHWKYEDVIITFNTPT